MMMFAGAAMTALDVLTKLAGAGAPGAAKTSAKDGSALQQPAFDLAGTAAPTKPTPGASATAPVPKLSSDTMNTLLLSLFDVDKDGKISAEEFKTAMGQNARLMAQQAKLGAAGGANAPGGALSISA